MAVKQDAVRLHSMYSQCMVMNDSCGCVERLKKTNTKKD